MVTSVVKRIWFPEVYQCALCNLAGTAQCGHMYQRRCHRTDSYDTGHLHMRGVHESPAHRCHDERSEEYRYISAVPLLTTSCLPVMAVLTKGLPVFFIPEQPLITSMWNNMIYHGSRRQAARFLALRAQRMALQKRQPRFSPSGVVASGISATTHMVSTPHDVFLTENLPRDA